MFFSIAQSGYNSDMSKTLAKQMQKEIVNELKKYPLGKTDFNLANYLGTQNELYTLSVANERAIARDFVNRHKGITPEQFLELLNGLYSGKSFNERTFGTKLIMYKKAYKFLYTPERIFDWLGNLSGWGEIDSLCQSTFTAEDLLGDWSSWSKVLDKMSRDRNISRRRASLVLLTMRRLTM